MAQPAGIVWNQRAGVAANARRVLPPMVSAYFSSVREFLAKDPAPKELHTLRLSSKRLRYTLELFRPCYPAVLEERIAALKKLQDWLGDVNDAVASAELLREPLKRQPKLRKFFQQRADAKAEGFTRHWNDTFDAPGREAWWTSFLARPLTPTRNIPKPLNPKTL